MIDNLSDPNELQFAAAHLDGLLNWHRKDKFNLYLIEGKYPLSSLWWYWDLGRRQGAFMHGVALEKNAKEASRKADLRHRVLIRIMGAA